MRSIMLAGLFGLVALSGTPGSSEAKGCLKGAAVGGVAGHMVGHHGTAEQLPAAPSGTTKRRSRIRPSRPSEIMATTPIRLTEAASLRP
jgi:hypothetical protein